MSEASFAQLSTKDEGRILNAEYQAKEAKDEVKELRRDMENRHADMLERIRDNKKIAEEVRDMHIRQNANLNEQISGMKLDVAHSLSEIKIAVTQGQTNGKWMKMLVWFVFAEIFVLIFGSIVAVIAKALISTLTS